MTSLGEIDHVSTQRNLPDAIVPKRHQFVALRTEYNSYFLGNLVGCLKASSEIPLVFQSCSVMEHPYDDGHCAAGINILVDCLVISPYRATGNSAAQTITAKKASQNKPSTNAPNSICQLSTLVGARPGERRYAQRGATP